MLTGLFYGAVDSFAGLFDGFYYIFTSASTSKADIFDNLHSMKIRTKRPEEEQNLQTRLLLDGLESRVFIEN